MSKEALQEVKNIIELFAKDIDQAVEAFTLPETYDELKGLLSRQTAAIERLLAGEELDVAPENLQFDAQKMLYEPHLENIKFAAHKAQSEPTWSGYSEANDALHKIKGGAELAATCVANAIEDHLCEIDPGFRINKDERGLSR